VTASGHYETEAAFIVRRMTELGFHPSPGDVDRVCFYKDYVDEEGRRARAYTYFDKPILGMESFRLSNFVVTVQTAIEPVPTAIAREAPEPMRDDLFGVVDAFAALVGRVPDQAVVTRDCVKCLSPSANFYVVNGDAICNDCVAQRRAQR
jgi:hypothetical protein